MNFNYDVYFDAHVITTGLWIIIDILIIILLIKYTYYPKNRKNDSKYKTFYFIGAMILPVFVLSVFISMFKPQLIWDDPDKTIEVTGEVTEIKSIYNSPRMMLEYDRAKPHYITIDHQEYYIMDLYGVKTGDTVIIEYLPRSKVIVYIDYVESE